MRCRWRRFPASWLASKILAWCIVVPLLVFRRIRHLVVYVVALGVTSQLTLVLSAVLKRPRPFGVVIDGSWNGYALPSVPLAILAASLVSVLYVLVPEGRWRQVGKWAATAIVALAGLGRVALGLDTPTDVLLGAVIGVTIPLLAFRWFTPNEVFPVSYRRGRSAHLDIGGARGEAIRRAVSDQLGLAVEEVKPFGLAGSAGSTPMRITVKGDPPMVLFGKLYARSHLRSDRWYKLGRELLYGRLEDEKAFNTVGRLVQQEDYALRLLRDAGLPTPAPYGVVELTPEREYLLVTEFFDDATELGEAEVDQGVIDDGLGIIRKLWDAGLAHRDIKPANLLVRDGRMLLIDVAFVQAHPSPWRQAVDLANMMLCLALRCQPRAGLRAGPAAVHGGGDHRGVRRHPRADHAVPAPQPHAGPRAATCTPSSSSSCPGGPARSPSSAGASAGSGWPCSRCSSPPSSSASRGAGSSTTRRPTTRRSERRRSGASPTSRCCSWPSRCPPPRWCRASSSCRPAGRSATWWSATKGPGSR